MGENMQDAYYLGCVTTIEKIQKWCVEQSRILKKQSEDFNDEECFGGYRAFEDMIRYLDTIK